MAVTFKDLLQKELRGRVKEGSQDAQILTAIKNKKAGLEGVINLRGEDFLNEETIISAESAADDLLDSLVEDMLDGIVEEGTKRRGANGRFAKAKVKVPKITGLRTKRGSFISALNLTRLLQLTLQRYIKQLMGTDGRLNYVTGRLAASANITELTESNGVGSLYFSYMVYPYATFEKGGKQYKPKRPPSELIDDAINLALNEILNKESAQRFIVRFGG